MRYCRIYNAIMSQLINRDELTARLKTAHYKVTTPRMELLETICTIHQPFTADELMNTLSKNKLTPHRATVYRDIVNFVNAGILRELVFQGYSARYFEYVDATNHHHHFLCTNCKQIIDVSPDEVEKALEKFQSSFTKGQIIHHNLKFYGLCLSCKETH